MSKGYDFLGDKIKKLRIFKGYSQSELGKALGLPKQAISVIEHGDRKVTTEELEKIAKFLNVPADFILKDGFIDTLVGKEYEYRNKWNLKISPVIDDYIADIEENYFPFIETGLDTKKVYIDELKNSIKALQLLIKEIKDIKK